MKYLLVDTANLFFRARHSVHVGTDAFTKLGFSLHLMFSSVNKAQRILNADHVVFCLEGRSWRKDVYEPYKKNRKAKLAKLTDEELAEDKLFWEVFEEFAKYLQESTNCTVLQHQQAEADDIIARWISLHTHDKHVILSSDSDFYQLITENVVQYNGISDQLITLEGYFDDKNRPIIDKKTNLPKLLPDPKWILFEKSIRGDTSDNIFSAYPGVRTKSTKKRIGLLEAFEDKDKKGYAWNNLMLQRWTDHNDNEHRVKDDYERNNFLIDLSKQPDDIKEAIDTMIKDTVTHKDVGMVGVKFMRFCGKHELNRLAEYPEQTSQWLNATYNGELVDSQ